LRRGTRPIRNICSLKFTSEFTMTSVDNSIQTFIERAAEGKLDTSQTKAKGKTHGGSWFEVLGEILGGRLDQRIQTMFKQMEIMKDNYKETLNVKGGEQQSGAYLQAMTQFQVQSQIFGQEANATSTVVKGLGEGMTTLARKGS
jgi:hypothetical protein